MILQFLLPWPAELLPQAPQGLARGQDFSVLELLLIKRH